MMIKYVFRELLLKLTLAKRASTILPVTVQFVALPLFPLPSSVINSGLTKLKPRNSSWAVALGGISGESA